MVRYSLAVVALALAACMPVPGGTSPSRLALAPTFERLRPIAEADGHYAAWADTARGPVALGRFRADPQGRLVDLAGQPLTTWRADVAPADVQALRVTQERPGATGAVPSDQVFLQGAFKGDAATLAPPMKAEAFTGRTGSFLLDNAATSADPEDWNGVWFAKVEFQGEYLVNYNADVMTPSLQLEQAPPGWCYAGWLQLAGRTVRMGKFDRVDRMDDWYGFSGLTGQSLPINPGGPPVPGEDFIKNLPAGFEVGHNKPDLAGAHVIVSLESAVLANEETFPSPLRLFEGDVPSPSRRLVNYPLENVGASGLPAGRAVLATP